MKKLLTVFSAIAVLGLIAAQTAETFIVAATPVPYVEILNVIRPLLTKEGVEPKAKEFTDYVQSNVQVSEKRPDANFFRHQPYLDEFDKARGADLVTVTGIHIEPLGVYSSKYKKLDKLPSGAIAVTPNDATNGGCALFLLDKAEVIKLRDNKSVTATSKDIADNPRNIKIHELEAVTLPHALTQVDMALINTNYALEAKLNPARDALAVEGSGSSYMNILATRPDNKDSDVMQKLAKALHSAEVKQFIQGKCKNAVVPAF